MLFLSKQPLKGNCILKREFACHIRRQTRREILADAAKGAAAASVTGWPCFLAWVDTGPRFAWTRPGANANVPIPAGHSHRGEVLNQDSVNASSIIQPMWWLNVPTRV